MARLATILSFGDHAEDDAAPDHAPAAAEEEYYRDQGEDDDAASDASGDSFEFSFARPLGSDQGDALADDLFAHGRILPAYPLFHHRRPHAHDDDDAPASSATAPPSPDTYCAWAPRSAPGSPAREPSAFPKSASTGTGEAARRFRLRDILGAAGRSHSDGKEKFLFFQPPPAKHKSKTSALSSSTASAAPPAGADKRAVKKASPQTKQGKKKAAAATSEMDMATVHRLFYSKPPGAAAGERTTTATKKSYLPYRPAIVGFFAAAHGLRPKHHPY